MSTETKPCHCCGIATLGGIAIQGEAYSVCSACQGAAIGELGEGRYTAENAHRWPGCRTINRSQRRRLLSAIAQEKRGRQFGKRRR